MIGIILAGLNGAVATVLLALAIYASYLNGSLALPTPILGHVLAVILPVLTFLALVFPSFLGKLASNRFVTPPTIPTILAIFDTILLTLASAELRPEYLHCTLERRWDALFRSKDDAIRRIEGSLRCCGLWSNLHEPWPFPDRDHDNQTCRKDYRWLNSCGNEWTQKAQFILGLWIAIGVYNLLVKALNAWIRIDRPSWFDRQGGYSQLNQGRSTGSGQRRRYLDQPREQGSLQNEIIPEADEAVQHESVNEAEPAS